MAIPLLATALLAVLAQDPPLPWRTDVAEARQECVKARKPFVLIINVDRDTTSKGSVEFHLKSSKEMRALCSTVTVAIVRQYEPLGIDLMKEFEQGYFGHCKIVVLEGGGELLGYFAAYDFLLDSSAAQEQALASKIVEKIEDCLKRKESLQELERRWRKEGNDPRLLDRLLDRLTELNRSEQFSLLAESVAGDEKQTVPVRNVARAWTLPLLGENPAEEARTRETAAAERLLAEVAGYEGAMFLLRTLMTDYYGEQFDVPAKVAAASARLEKVAAAQPDPAPLRKRIADLERLFREWKEDGERELKKYEPGEDDPWGAHVRAMLGDAKAAIDVLGALPEKERAPYRRWIEEARAKLKDR